MALAKWTTNTQDIKVLSRERIEDRNPSTYVQRGDAFKKAGKFKEAEREYLKAYQLSEKNDEYLMPIIELYYATKNKRLVRKAEKMHRALYWRDCKFLISVVMCIFCYGMVHFAINGFFIMGLLLFCVMHYLLGNDIRQSKADAQNKDGRYLLRLPIGLVLLFIFLNCGYEGVIPELPITISRLLAIPFAGIFVFFLVQALISVISFIIDIKKNRKNRNK